MLRSSKLLKKSILTIQNQKKMPTDTLKDSEQLAAELAHNAVLVTIERLLGTVGELCSYLDWNIEEIEHLGFLHTIERYEQFEQDGWK